MIRMFFWFVLIISLLYVECVASFWFHGICEFHWTTDMDRSLDQGFSAMPEFRFGPDTVYLAFKECKK